MQNLGGEFLVRHLICVLRMIQKNNIKSAVYWYSRLDCKNQVCHRTGLQDTYIEISGNRHLRNVTCLCQHVSCLPPHFFLQHGGSRFARNAAIFFKVSYRYSFVLSALYIRPHLPLSFYFPNRPSILLLIY